MIAPMLPSGTAPHHSSSLGSPANLIPGLKKTLSVRIIWFKRRHCKRGHSFETSITVLLTDTQVSTSVSTKTQVGWLKHTEHAPNFCKKSILNQWETKAAEFSSSVAICDSSSRMKRFDIVSLYELCHEGTEDSQIGEGGVGNRRGSLLFFFVFFIIIESKLWNHEHQVKNTFVGFCSVKQC